MQERQQTAQTIIDMRRWWTSKAKWYHRGNGHFNIDLYIKICEAKENEKYKTTNN